MLLVLLLSAGNDYRRAIILSLARVRLHFVQSALFGTRLPPPPSRAAVFAGPYGSGAGCAADAWIAAVVQRVVCDVMHFDVRPHIVCPPIEERIGLDQAVRIVPAFQFETLPCRRLLPPEACNPAFLPGQRALQRLHLPDVAALLALRDAFIERIRPILLDPGLDCYGVRKVCANRHWIL